MRHPKPYKVKTSRFMFENKWLLEIFLDVVAPSWKREATMTRLSSHIKKSTSASKVWAKDKVGNTGKRIKKTLTKLTTMLDKVDMVWDKEKVITMEAELEKLKTEDELHWPQCSRIYWLSAGDKNTSYFHNFASSRRKGNTIKTIKSDEGI